jgi:hypothetical protein
MSSAGYSESEALAGHRVPSEMLVSSVAAGNVNRAGNTVLSSLLAAAKAEFEAKDFKVRSPC